MIQFKSNNHRVVGWVIGKISLNSIQFKSNNHNVVGWSMGEKITSKKQEGPQSPHCCETAEKDNSCQKKEGRGRWKLMREA